MNDENKMCALVVDDDEGVRMIMTRILEKEGIGVVTASDGQQALRMLKSLEVVPDIILLDVRMPELSGMDVLKKIRETGNDLPVIFITGYAGIRQSVEAMKEGAYDYLAKPFDNAEVARITLHALAEWQLKKYKILTGESLAHVSLFKSMGSSDAVVRVTTDVHRVAKSDFSVLLVGETGSGKDLVAEAIHRGSARRTAPFIVVDCGAIPEALLESELFGHEKGAFTGADRQKMGKFELAQGGTLFLDELGNLAHSSQAKLLRAIQSKVIHRVGGIQPITVDFRLIAATNRNLRKMVVEGSFREDLYYRLCEFMIEIPSLRERKIDIIYLAKRFLDMAENELGKKIGEISGKAVEALISYDWPGNVRELKAVIRRAALVATGPIEEKDLGIDSGVKFETEALSEKGDQIWKGRSLRDIVRRSVVEVEKKVLTGALQVTGGNKAKAARLLQVDYKTLHTKAKKFGIQTKAENEE